LVAGSLAHTAEELEQRLKVIGDVEFVAASINVMVRQCRCARRSAADERGQPAK